MSSSPTPTPSSSLIPPSSTPFVYPIEFPHPLLTVSSHPGNSSQFCVADANGTVHLVDWQTALDSDERSASWRMHRVCEMYDPRKLADSITGVGQRSLTGGAGWKPQDTNIFGATFGSRWLVWDLRRLQGGKPVAAGEAFAEGGHRFKWCPTDPHLFAVSTTSPANGAIINVYHTSFPGSPRSYQILPRPHRLRDFDWLDSLSVEGSSQTLLAAAVGSKMYFIQAGDLSTESM